MGVALAAAVGASCFHAAGFAEASAADAAPASQSSSQGGVTITVAPSGFSSEARTWDFTITMETHTQPLDDDLTETSALLGDGKAHRPLGWDGALPGGHHRKGVLHFTAIKPLPKAVELQIRRNGEESVRVFRWQTK